MKRHGFLIDAIADLDNIELAHARARRGKTYQRQVQSIDTHLPQLAPALSRSLVEGTYRTGQYTIRAMNERGKARTIYRLPYWPDRVTHHAICQILTPLWRPTFIRHTYASIPGRGIHDARDAVATAGPPVRSARLGGAPGCPVLRRIDPADQFTRPARAPARAHPARSRRMTTLTTAAAGPVAPIERHGTGWEIRTLVTNHDPVGVEGEPGFQAARCTYARVTVPALSSADVSAAVATQQDGDPDVLAQAQAIALDSLAPQVVALTDAVDTLIFDSLGG